MKHYIIPMLLVFVYGSIWAQYPVYHTALKSFPFEELEEAQSLELFQIQLEIKEIGCGRSDNGAITAKATGGLPPYTWAWSNGASTNQLSNLEVGTYHLLITDARGAKVEQEVILRNTLPIAIDFIVLPDTNNQRKINAIISGGKAPYQLRWNNGSSEDLLKGLDSGSYQLEVTDQNQCKNSRSIELEEEVPFSFQKADTRLINIMPNPTQGIVTIEYPDKFNYSSQVQLFDASGQFLRKYPQILPLTKSMEIDLTGLQNGFYFIRIEWGGQSVIKKIVLVD